MSEDTVVGADAALVVVAAGTADREITGVALSVRRRVWPWVVASLGLIAGLAERAWFAAHIAINADVAVAGEMADAIRRGHMNAFFWGQHYGGAEPYLVAAVSYLTRPSWIALVVTPVLLSVVASLLVWGIVSELTGDRALGAMAGALAFVWPGAAVIDSVREWGFRAVTLCCGLACLWLAVRVRRSMTSYTPKAEGAPEGIQYPDPPRKLARWDLAALGGVAGIGWWSSPEIAFWLVPAGLVLASAVVHSVRKGQWRQWVGPGGAAVMAFAVGALPWIWANVHTGFASLDARGIYAANSTFGVRFRSFFTDVIPLEMGLRTYGGAWAKGPELGHVFYAAGAVVLVVVLVVCILRRGTAAWIAGGSFAFPFLYGANPGGWWWLDGRYALALPLLACILVAVAADEVARRVHGTRESGRNGRSMPGAVSTVPVGGGGNGERAGNRRMARRQERAVVRLRLLIVATVVAVAGITTMIGLNTGVKGQLVHGYVTGWDPESRVDHSIAVLESHGVRAGWSDYWTGYVLDEISGNRLEIGVVGPDRWPALNASVRRAPIQAWIFLTPDPGRWNDARADYPGWIGGPIGMTSISFENLLNLRGIGYSVVDAGDIVAVVPDRRFTPEDAGVPASKFWLPR